MVDEYKPKDEYSLGSNGKHAKAFSSSNSTKTNALTPKLAVLRNVVLAGLGLLLVVLVVYKLLGMFMTKRTGTSKVTPVQLTQPAPIKKPQPAVTSAPSSTMAALQSRLERMQDAQQAQTKAMQQVQQQLSALQVSLANFKADIDTLDTSVHGVEQQMTRNNRQIRVLHRKVFPPKHHATKRAKPLPPFYLSAVIPGRAWIERLDGSHSMTVSVGRSVPGYGLVKRIDAPAGRVMTSSGKVIHFNLQHGA